MKQRRQSGVVLALLLWLLAPLAQAQGRKERGQPLPSTGCSLPCAGSPLAAMEGMGGLQALFLWSTLEVLRRGQRGWDGLRLARIARQQSRLSRFREIVAAWQRGRALPQVSTPAVLQGYLRPLPGESVPGIHYSDIFEGREIALTFDDGPHPAWTPRILRILRAHRVKATFFVIGRNAWTYPWLVRRILRQGHSIGHHSWDHTNFATLSNRAILRQLRLTQKAIDRALQKKDLSAPRKGNKRRAPQKNKSKRAPRKSSKRKTPRKGNKRRAPRKGSKRQGQKKGRRRGVQSNKSQPRPDPRLPRRYPIRYLRLPYGSPVMGRYPYRIRVRVNTLLRQQRLYSIFWNIDSGDWTYRGRQQQHKIIEQVLRTSYGRGGVVLLHDIHPQSYRILSSLLTALKRRKYRIVPLRTLLEQKYSPLNPDPYYLAPLLYWVLGAKGPIYAGRR